MIADKATRDAAWQPAQSLFAISSGGFWGLGIGKSNQKHGFLPEPQNDYVFAILCEELGFFGAVRRDPAFCGVRLSRLPHRSKFA